MNLLVPPRTEEDNNRSYACRILRMNIMNLRLEPGEVLSEPMIAEMLQMSRTPIHEAITKLHEQWLVDIFPQKATKVSRIDPILVKEGYQARLLFESQILRESAGKISREQIQEMLQCLRKMEELDMEHNFPKGVETFIRLDDEFHQMMYFFSGMCHTWMAIRGLVAHYDRVRYLDAMDGKCRYAVVQKQHHEFCDYLLMGMPEGCSPDQKVYEHLDSFRGNLLEKIEQHPGFFTLDRDRNG